MRLKFPNLSSTVLIGRMRDDLGKDPEKLRAFILGQMKFVRDEINKVNPKFPFEKYVRLSNESTIKKYNKIYDAYILAEFKKWA